MNKDMTQKYRISITETTYDDLEKLRYAFEGKMAHGEHQNCSDDVLVAALLGWHLRSIGNHSDYFAKALALEYSYRHQLALDPKDSWLEDRERDLRNHFRGQPSTAGNVLTLDGIDLQTVRRIEARSHAVARMIESLDPQNGQGSWDRLPRYSDQAIIDLGIWWTLTNHQLNGSDEVEEYPRWIKDEIMARGQARAEFEAGVPDLQPVPRKATRKEGEKAATPEVLPSLTPLQRAAFFRSRRITNQDRFWTDERIRLAMEMGL